MVGPAAALAVGGILLGLALVTPPDAGLDPLTVAHAHALASGFDGTLFLGHHDGVLASDDGGRSWNERLQGWDVMALVPATDGRLVASGHGFLADLLPSGGWVEHGTDLPTLDIHSVAAAPSLRDRWIAAADGRIFRSADDGASWQAVSEGPLALVAGGPGRLIGVDPFRGIVASADGGEWSPWASPPTAPIVSLAASADDGAVVVGSAEGAFLTVDRGASWTRLSAVPVTAVAVTSDAATVLVLRRDGVVEPFAIGSAGPEA